MERIFQILAVILAGVAAFFLWRGNGDGAFVTAVFGAVSFFLSIRFQVKDRIKKREEEEISAELQSRESAGSLEEVKIEPEIWKTDFEVGEAQKTSGSEQK